MEIPDSWYEWAISFEVGDEMDFGPSTTAERFDDRIWKHRQHGVPVVRHHFWWAVHNCVAHPLIGVLPNRWTFAFHDYTSRKINLR